MLYRQRIVELLAPHCDIVTGLKAVPAAARVRGLYFRALADEMTRRGLRPAFEEVIHDSDRSAFTLYPLGDYLVGQLEAAMRMAAAAPAEYRIAPGDSYVLGDSPLVTLTALQSPFQPDPSSCTYEMRPRPTIDVRGHYGRPAHGPAIRVYTRIDTRLTFEDLYAKLAAGRR